MAHIYNDPSQFVSDAIKGFLAAYGTSLQAVPGASGVMRRGWPRAGLVSVVVGGGSGHYPAFCGLVGHGIAHGAVIGDVFTSPSTEQVYRVGCAVDGGAGVLLTFGNYAGDVMNFGAAQGRMRSEGIDCRTVLVTDDIASGPVTNRAQRRGIAGDLAVFKVAGTAADRGDSINEVERLALAANAATSSFGVAFGGCTFPGRTEPLFTVAAGKMELGLGIHGEPGTQTVDWVPARELAALLVTPLLAERPAGARRACVLLNGLGATKYEELFVLYGTVHRLLVDAGVELVMPEIGELVTSLDMAGCSLTVMWLDAELEELWCAPADTPAFRRAGLLPVDEAAVSVAKGAGPAVGTGQQAVTRRVPAAPPAAAGPAGGTGGGRVRAVLHAMLDVLVENEAELGRLDAVAGDGDHGVGMVRGMRGAVAAADAAPEPAGGAVLRLAADAFADRAGGSSGALWGALLGGIADALTEQAAGRGALDAVATATAINRGAGELQRLGGCNVGDKTMFDALRPFADELAAQITGGAPLAQAWAAAAAVASSSAAATAALVARLGRARPLGERSVGTPDPGAVSMALCLAAAGEALAVRSGSSIGVKALPSPAGSET